MAQDLSTDHLIDLYKIAIDEYRFEVKLNWDRTVFYLTLNSGLIAIATGLLKVEGRSFLNLIVAGVFFIGLCVSWIGIRRVRRGHDYYRRTIVKKTLLEDRLGVWLYRHPSAITHSSGPATTQQKQGVLGNLFWCPREDSNLHAVAGTRP